MPRAVDDPCNKYVGLSEADAVQRIEDDGLISRVMGRDGKSFMGTCDYLTDRVNLVVAAGVIISANIG